MLTEENLDDDTLISGVPWKEVREEYMQSDKKKPSWFQCLNESEIETLKKLS